MAIVLVNLSQQAPPVQLEDFVGATIYWYYCLNAPLLKTTRAFGFCICLLFIIFIYYMVALKQ